MPIYTKKGDKGKTKLANGQEISKGSEIIEFIGDLDELNSILGVCISSLKKYKKIDFEIEIEVIEEIQNDLFVVGAIASGAKLSFNSVMEVSNIEETIDDYEKLLPKIKNFVLPGGTEASANIFLARSLVRKLERKLIQLNSSSVMPFLPYLNRLSDLLFVMSRFVNYKTKTPEKFWISSKR